MEKNEKVGPGKYVRYAYKLYSEPDNELLFEATEEQPDEMIYGVSHEVVPGLIAVVKDLGEGDKFSITLPPEAAFGQRFDENVVTLEKEIFMRDGEMAEEVVVGAELPMMTAEGMRILGKVIEIDDNGVKMDFNHPFAGKTVRFDGKVIEVRDATPEELKPAGSCGCGHCGSGDCGDGNCGDGGCGDSCGCGNDSTCGCK